jgi:hypothetical protein
MDAPAGESLFDFYRAWRAALRRPEIRLSQGAEWKALIST